MWRKRDRMDFEFGRVEEDGSGAVRRVSIHAAIVARAGEDRPVRGGGERPEKRRHAVTNGRGRGTEHDPAVLVDRQTLDIAFEQVGLRGIVANREISKVYKILKEKTVPSDSQTWNRRYREYMEKIRTGSAFEVAEVLRDLLLLRIGKDLSFGERRMLDMAKGLLVKELSIAQKSPEDRIEKHIEALFA